MPKGFSNYHCWIVIDFVNEHAQEIVDALSNVLSINKVIKLFKAVTANCMLWNGSQSKKASSFGHASALTLALYIPLCQVEGGKDEKGKNLWHHDGYVKELTRNGLTRGDKRH